MQRARAVICEETSDREVKARCCCSLAEVRAAQFVILVVDTHERDETVVSYKAITQAAVRRTLAFIARMAVAHTVTY